MPLQRYKLTIAYRGTAYHGWQFQTASNTWKGEVPKAGRGIPTVQETLRRALEEVVRHPVTLVGSSRTDARVHAKGQVAHFDTDQGQIPAEGMRRAVNHALPDDILVREIKKVPQTFSAVLSTECKRYQYLIWNSLDRPVFFADMAWHRWQELDVAAMAKAAALLKGEHDFTSFARPGHGRVTTVRRLNACAVRSRGPRVVIGVEGNGFLWNMVRIIAGTLVDVGMGKLKAESMPDILAAKDRRAGGGTAPPEGLYLQWIRFRAEDEGENVR